jgi:hypothetical protein
MVIITGNWKGCGHGLFQGTIPAFAWNDWQIWYIPSYIISSTCKSFVSFLLELSVYFIFNFVAHYSNIVLGIKLTHKLSDCLWKNVKLREHKIY